MKKIHKWVGIFISLIVIWMSVSGIMLNHPELIDKFSIASDYIPEHYNLKNWNRSTLVGNLNLGNHIYFYGRQGIYSTTNNGRSFKELSVNGYPEYARLKRTNHLTAYIEANDTSFLASTNGGLYKMSQQTNTWQSVKVPTERPILKAICKQDGIYVFTDSEAFKYNPNTQNVAPLELKRNNTKESMPLVDFFFLLHDGSAWGLTGKLIFDFAGLVLIFLSFSGIYIWLKPKSIKKRKNKKAVSSLRFFFKNHLKYGIWLALPILIISTTGIFMRPPLIMVLTGEIPLKYYPGIQKNNPWHHKIRNILWDSSRDVFVIDAKDGYYVGQFGKGFDKTNPPVPIFPMGATVFEEKDGKYIIGSFLGLFECDITTGSVKDMVSMENANIINPFMPGKNMITGAAFLPNGEIIIATHEIGVINSEKYQMPEVISKNYRMPLWNFMFELHNGRLFKSLIGSGYILLVPLSGILLLLVSLSGVYRYIVKKVRLKGNSKSPVKRIKKQKGISIDKEPV